MGVTKRPEEIATGSATVATVTASGILAPLVTTFGTGQTWH
ncbi:hypothetical protein [Nonomuraea sp. NPDC050786]